MNKLLVLLSVGVLVLGMAGCGDQTNGSGGQQSGAQTNGSGQQSGEQTSGGGQQSDAQTNGDGQQSGAQTNGDGQQGGGSSEGSDEGQATGAVVNGYDYQDGWTEEMQGVRNVVTDALGDDYWPDMPMMPDMLEAVYGVSPDMYEDYMAEAPMISTNVDTLVIVRAKEDKAEAVEEALNAYRDANINDTMQYPMNVGKIQASRIEKIGDYICFVQLGADTMDLEDEAAIAHCQEVNELVIEILHQQLQE